jgi:DNA-binding PadR family transcriptional regulator
MEDDVRKSTTTRARAETNAQRARRDAPAATPRPRLRVVQVRHRDDLAVLLLAAAGHSPGNAPHLIDVVRRLSGGVFRLSEHTVYHALHRLKDNRLVWISWEDGSRRYMLTPLGERVLDTRRREWAAFSYGFDKVLNANSGSDR